MAAVIESLVNRILECEEIAEKENRRFIAVKDSETYDIVQSERNANTVRATSSHLRLFKNWLQSEQEFRQPESISQQDLDMYLARFFLSIRKTASDSESKSVFCNLFPPSGFSTRFISSRRFSSWKHYH
jgi:hypothetical protein